jgi:hypothetical protein
MNTDGVQFDTPPRGTLNETSANRRPSTPHPNLSEKQHASSNFDFGEVDGQIELADDSTQHESCIGISLQTFINTIKGEKDVPLSDQSNGQRGFFPSLKAMMQKTLSPMSWSSGGRTPRTQTEDIDDYDLMNRLPSWKTLESPSVYRSRSQRRGTPEKQSSSSKQVQFQYPPITSIRLRPRTESDEIDKLYFHPDELDQIEDDRSDTKAADDIETLCVVANPSDDMDLVPGVTESMSSPSDELSSTGFSFISRRKSSSTSPSSSSSSSGPKKKKRIVQGVQILLREKSLG